MSAVEISYTIAADSDGIVRSYRCDNYFDATVLADILERSGQFRYLEIQKFTTSPTVEVDYTWTRA